MDLMDSMDSMDHEGFVGSFGISRIDRVYWIASISIFTHPNDLVVPSKADRAPF